MNTFYRKICALEARVLSRSAIKLFEYLDFESEWDTNFATGRGGFTQLDLLILKLIIEKRQPKKFSSLVVGNPQWQ